MRAFPSGARCASSCSICPGVTDLRIEAESAQSANLTLRYPGGPAELAAALNSRGLALESGADGLRPALRPMSAIVGGRAVFASALRA